MEFKCPRASKKAESWRDRYSHQAQKQNKANMMRTFILIHVPPRRTDSEVIIVKQMIGEEKARKVEELAIQLYSKVLSSFKSVFFG
jgi:hypothetical protein